MELLVKAGAPPNVQDNAGRTPLHVTAIHGFYLRTDSLISSGIHHSYTLTHYTMLPRAQSLILVQLESDEVYVAHGLRFAFVLCC